MTKHTQNGRRRTKKNKSRKTRNKYGKYTQKSVRKKFLKIK